MWGIEYLLKTAAKYIFQKSSPAITGGDYGTKEDQFAAFATQYYSITFSKESANVQNNAEIFKEKIAVYCNFSSRRRTSKRTLSGTERSLFEVNLTD